MVRKHDIIEFRYIDIRVVNIFVCNLSEERCIKDGYIHKDNKFIKSFGKHLGEIIEIEDNGVVVWNVGRNKISTDPHKKFVAWEDITHVF